MDKSLNTAVLANLQRALDRLEAILKKDAVQEPAFIDATIQRFEFCFDLTWKTLKIFLADEAMIVKTPKEAFRTAFKINWLPDGEALWLQMIDDRNLTSHTYDEVTANRVYKNIPGYAVAFRNLYNFLQQR